MTALDNAIEKLTGRFDVEAQIIRDIVTSHEEDRQWQAEGEYKYEKMTGQEIVNFCCEVLDGQQYPTGNVHKIYFEDLQ